MPIDAAAMRARLLKKLSGRQADPDEFKPPKVKEGQTLKYFFYVLPPLAAGDKCAKGTASRDMEVFYVDNGDHWVDKKPYPCPRIINGEQCDMCQTGFDLMGEVEDKKKRSLIAKNWLASANAMVNIYFPPIASNPEELRDRVMFFRAGKAVHDDWVNTAMREDEGNPEDPEAYGMFFDENAAFLYSLTIVHDNGYNGYKKSKFIYHDGKGNVARGPIAKTKDGQPDRKKIQEILDRRHDLFTKVGTPDKQQIKLLVERLLHGDDSGGFDTTEEEPATEATKPAEQRQTKTATAAPIDLSQGDSAPVEVDSDAELDALLDNANLED